MRKKWNRKRNQGYRNRWTKALVAMLSIGLVFGNAIPAYSAENTAESAAIEDTEAEVQAQAVPEKNADSDAADGSGYTDAEPEAADDGVESQASETAETEETEQADSGAADQAEPVIRRIIRKDNFTQTYLFRDEDGTEISRQILSDEETLIQPSVPETKDGHAFAGWYREDGTEFSDTEFGRTARQLNGDEPLTEETTGTPIILTAKYRSSYVVQYLSSSDPDASVAFTQDYAEGDTIEYADLREVVQSHDETKELIGWSRDPAAAAPDQAFVIHEDTRLYPVFDGAHWIDFETNGGTPVQSVYVEYHQPTSEPATPTRPGYTLDGWYTDPECTAQFTFGGTISQDTILYAKWVPAATSRYRVVYWVQNSTDRYDTPENEKTYYYWGSQVVLNVVTDSVVSATDEEKNYPVSRWDYQLVYNGDKSESGKKVLADGSTELNLYFDRQVITLNFYRTRDEINQGAEPQVVMKGLYGQTPAFYHYTFPELGENQYWLDTIRGWEWHPENVWFYDPYRSGKTVDNFYIIDGTYYYTYYDFYENLDGTWPEKPDPENGTIAYSGGHTWVSSKESESSYYLEQIRVDTKTGGTWQEGPWKNVYKEDGSVDTTVVDKSGKDVGVVGNGKLVYHRMKRSVHRFILRNAATKYSQRADIVSYPDIRYGTPIRDLGKYYSNIDVNRLQDIIQNPPRPENVPDYYIFDGWYTSETFKTPFDFETATMGNGDRIAYARWMAPDVHVVAKLNNGREDINLTTHAGEKAAEPPIPVRKNFAFIGWVDRFGRPFDFETPITKDTIVYAAWVSTVRTYTVSYDLNGGSGSVPVDQSRYYEGARAKAAASAGLKPPAGKKGFLAWQGDDGMYYFPGDAVLIPEQNLVLKAVWADDRVTKLTYDYGYDTREGGRTESEIITNPNADYPVTKKPEREGYRFVRWETRDGLAVHPGEVIHVDTINPDGNVLLAIWEKEDTPAESGNTAVPASSQQSEPAASAASAASGEKPIKSSTVETGDAARPALAVTMLLLSGAGIGVWILDARRKRRKSQ